MNRLCKSEDKFTGTKTNKLENCFKMLQLLRTNGRMKTAELMKALEVTSKRSINYYKTTLIYLGYQIESYGGYTGGMQYVPSEKLNDNELNLIAQKLGGENSALIEKIKRINSERK